MAIVYHSGSGTGWNMYAAMPLLTQKADTCSILGLNGSLWAAASRDASTPAGGYGAIPDFAALIASIRASGKVQRPVLTLGAVRYLTLILDGSATGGQHPHYVDKKGSDNAVIMLTYKAVILCTGGMTIQPPYVLDAAGKLADELCNKGF